jgi:hypothetical protein
MSDAQKPGGPPPLPEKPKSGAVKTNILPTAKAAFLEEAKAEAKAETPPKSEERGSWALPKRDRPADKTGTTKTAMLQSPTADEVGLEPLAPPMPEKPVDTTGTSKTRMLQSPSESDMGLAPKKVGPPPIPTKKPTSAPGVAKTNVLANARADFLLDDFAGDIDVPEEKAAELGAKKKDGPKK